MDVNAEGIYAMRLSKIYGEGPSTMARPSGERFLVFKSGLVEDENVSK